MAPTDANGRDSWTEWRQHVLITLKDLNSKMDQVRLEVAGLKVKAGIWGLVGAAIPVLLGLSIVLIKAAIAGQ